MLAQTLVGIEAQRRTRLSTISPPLALTSVRQPSPGSLLERRPKASQPLERLLLEALPCEVPPAASQAEAETGRERLQQA